MRSKIAVSVQDVSKTFKLSNIAANSIREKIFLISRRKKRELKALDAISFKVRKGEIFGIIGRNGSGKSTLLKILMGAISPDKDGTVEVNGKIIKLSLAMGFDRELTARDNIYVNGAIIGLSLKKIGQKFNDIIEFAELEDFIDTKIKFYSSGMRARLAFSIAIHAEADIYLFDEFFGGVGDIGFNKKSKNAFKSRFLKDKTIIMVSHSMKNIMTNCSRVMCIDKGVCIAKGKPEKVIRKYKKALKIRKKPKIE